MIEATPAERQIKRLISKIHPHQQEAILKHIEEIKKAYFCEGAKMAEDLNESADDWAEAVDYSENYHKFEMEEAKFWNN